MDSPFAPSSSSSPGSSSSSSSGATSTTMVIITVVGILAAFALLASYYAFVTKCQLLRALLGSRHPPWQRRLRRAEATAPSVIRAAAAGEERRGLGLPLIRMLPVVKFTAAGCGGGDAAAPRISVSECAVCLSEFVERERVRLLPNCSHAFHIDCIDTWLQGSARCPFCRSDVTLPSVARRAPADTAACPGRRPGRLDDGGSDDSSSIVIEVRGDRERWFSSSHHGATTGGGRSRPKLPKTESLGDEAIDTRKRGNKDEASFLRRSLSLDSCCDKHLYVSVQELLASQRQVCDPPVRS